MVVANVKEFRVLGEKVLTIIRRTDSCMLVETETVFYILAFDKKKEKWVPVQGLSKMMYDVSDAIQEFEDFVGC